MPAKEEEGLDIGDTSDLLDCQLSLSLSQENSTWIILYRAVDTPVMMPLPSPAGSAETGLRLLKMNIP